MLCLNLISITVVFEIWNFRSKSCLEKSDFTPYVFEIEILGARGLCSA